MTENQAVAAGGHVPERLVAARPRSPLRKRVIGWLIRLAILGALVVWVLPRKRDNPNAFKRRSRPPSEKDVPPVATATPSEGN